MVNQSILGTIFCAGGNERGIADNTAEFFDSTSQKWMPAATMRRKRSDFGLVTARGKVFAVGGWTDFGKRLNSVEIYDPAKDGWKRCSSMCTSRSQVTVCHCQSDGCIYAIGGESRGGIAKRSTERFDPETNRWTKGPKMAERRWSACSCSRAEDGCVYVVGGYDESNGGALAACERYDPRVGHWMKIANMGQKRCGAALTILHDSNIYVVGGTNEKMAQLATAECYNARNDRWDSLPAMKYPRSFFGVAPFDNGRLLYAIGGAEFTEIYDPRTFTWSVSDVQLGRKRNRHGVVWCDWNWDSGSQCRTPERECSKEEDTSVETSISPSDDSDTSMQISPDAESTLNVKHAKFQQIVITKNVSLTLDSALLIKKPAKEDTTRSLSE